MQNSLMKLAKLIHFNILAFVLIGLQAQSAFAYLDPGTGSMILQGIVAAVAVAGVTAKHYWYKIQSLFGKEPPQVSLLDDDDEQYGEDK